MELKCVQIGRALVNFTIIWSGVSTVKPHTKILMVTSLIRSIRSWWWLKSERFSYTKSDFIDSNPHVIEFWWFKRSLVFAQSFIFIISEIPFSKRNFVPSSMSSPMHWTSIIHRDWQWNAHYLLNSTFNYGGVWSNQMPFRLGTFNQTEQNLLTLLRTGRLFSIKMNTRKLRIR